MNTRLNNMRKTSLLLLILIILLIGCAQESEEPTPTATQVIAEQATEAPTQEPTISETPEPTSTAEPTITPEPTPVIPSITVETQTLAENGLLLFDSITSPQPGWVVVFADDNGVPGAELGFEAIPQGESKSISVTIDPSAATPLLYARLHRDDGTRGEFEYPGSDMPVETGSGEVLESFSVELAVPIPTIEVIDQDVSLDGIVQIDEVFALAPNWLVIHNLEDGNIGQPIGQTPVDEGQSTDLQVPIRWRDATAELVAVLHDDPERPGGFNVATDFPVLSGGEPVAAQFEVQLPPDILVYDQPVLGGKLILERVVSTKPGWLVVYSSIDGQPDRIIGSAKVSQGINYLVEAEIIETAVTPQLFLQLHEETNNAAEFNFPISDPAATFDGQPIAPTSVITNPGNYLLTQDQTLGEENEVVIPLVVTDLDSWLVIYTQSENGRLGEIIGQGWLPAGINRDIRIAVPAGMAGRPLFAALHQDAENPREFDFPDGDDVPLQRNRQIIVSPFMLKELPEAGTFSP
jgi:ABC-type Fe3+-hydroxamate transport system substrate-binding protein